MKQKNKIQELIHWPHDSFLVNLTFISLPENSKLNDIIIAKRYKMLIHANPS
jgi:hypothetical protein